MCLTILPPLVINTTLGFLLFTSHSFFALTLARLPFFQPSSNMIQIEESLSIQTILAGPTIIPNHPTLLSSLAGAGAGIVQGMAFTPIENIVRLLQQSASSATALLVRALRLPLPNIQTAEPLVSSPAEVIRNFFASERWSRSPSWWAGWRWTVARDA